MGQPYRTLVPPEQLEAIGHRTCRRTANQHIAIDVVEIVVPVEVAILIVATTGDADAVIHQKKLVVHALVELEEAAGNAGGPLQRRGMCVMECWVVQPDFQIRTDPCESVEQRRVV